MGLFSKGKSGGLMNVIRCDQEEYLIWKWRPEEQDVNSTTRENSIRYGSTLRVKDGEVAVFVYKQREGSYQDFIVGPHDETIKTENFPILSSIVGLAFGGESPFQAEVYFINLQGNNQIRFGIPFFDVFDPRLSDHGIPMSVRGTITFNITDYRNFIKLNRLTNFDIDDFCRQVRDAVNKYVKGVVVNIPQNLGIPAVQMERQILEINDKVRDYLKPRLEEDFGVNMKNIDIAALEIDKESQNYQELRQLTAGNTGRTLNAQTDINIKNLQDMQSINARNMAETMQIQREEAQRAQRLQTESNFIGAHQANLQADVLKTGAQNLGQMGNISGGEGGGMNPAAMMTGMMMGGAMGQQMSGMMNNMSQQMQQSMNTPPPIPGITYYIAINGTQSGPFNMQQLAQMAQCGQINIQTYVWKQGMPNWEMAGNIAELQSIFMPQMPGAIPPPPPMPGI